MLYLKYKDSTIGTIRIFFKETDKHYECDWLYARWKLIAIHFYYFRGFQVFYISDYRQNYDIPKKDALKIKKNWSKIEI